MQSPVLLLESRPSADQPVVAHMAATMGLQVLVAPWSSCSVKSQGIVIQKARSIRSDGFVGECIGTLYVRPGLIAVLDPTPATLAHGSQLALATGSLWGHCDLVSTLKWPPLSPSDDYADDGLITPDAGQPLGLAVTGRLAERVLYTYTTAEQSHRASPLRSRTCAPCGVRALADGAYELVDGLAPDCPDAESRRTLLRKWLAAVKTRIDPQPAVELGGEFARLYGTWTYIDTAYEPEAKELYIDPTLDLAFPGSDRIEGLRKLLARRRCAHSPSKFDRRTVEVGVGRACLVDGLRVGSDPDFKDFTVLGVGVTPFSEGGFVEVGRKIDGKATVRRGWHRKYCAERLESSDCRAGRVVAMYEVPGDGVEMLDGSVSPEALIVRAFRCNMRVKQLDPLICCMHSTQHTPLTHAYVAQRAIERRGNNENLEWLSHVLLMYEASQESLRSFVLDPAPSPEDLSWEACVRQARIDAIRSHAPFVLRTVFDRLSRELQAPVDESFYLEWFATSVGEQLARWYELRFLYDYHHPGISRWKPLHLYTLGENNVTLLAEFPDLDTGVFIDDEDSYLASALQLPAADIPVLRERFGFFHNRELEAALATVKTLAAILSHCYGDLGVDAPAIFEKAYNNARYSTDC